MRRVASVTPRGDVKARRAVLVRVAALLPIFAASCAFTGAPHPSLPQPPRCPAPALSAIEGQPRGVLLGLEWVEPPPAACGEELRVVLLRQPPAGADGGEAPWDVLYELDRAQTPSPARFLDPAPASGATVRYLLGLARADGALVASSPPVSVTWAEPLSPPREVQAEPLGGHILVSWPTEAEAGALVFRREVGVGGFERRSPVLGPGADGFVDDRLQPGAVYSYIVSRVRFVGQLPLIGAPSPEVYVVAGDGAH